MGLITEQYRIFVYDPNRDEGAYAAIADLWAADEKEALQKLQASTSRQLSIVEGGGFVAANSADVQFIARAHSQKHRWPSVDTGRLPQSDNQALRDDFKQGRLI